MTYYYQPGTAMPPTEKAPGVYGGSLQGSMPGSLPASMAYQQQTGLPPGGHSGLSSHAGLTAAQHAQAYGSVGATHGHGYPANTGYAALGTSPYAAQAALYQPSSLGYPQATLAPSSAYLAGAQSSYGGARVPATTAGYPGTYSTGNSMYGYSSLAGAPMSTPAYHGHSMAGYPAGAMPGTLSSYPTVTPGGSHLPPGASYPGTPYSRQIP